MSAALQETTLPDAAQSGTREALDTRLGIRLPRLTRAQAQLVAALGRVAVVWLPAYAFVPFAHPLLGSSAFTVTFFALVWATSLSGAFAAQRRCWRPLGLAPAAVVGTVTGAVLISAVSLWSSASLATGRFGVLALWVFACAFLWERLVESTVVSVRRVLFVGSGHGVADAAQDLVLAKETPFKAVGLVTDDSAGVAGLALHAGYENLAEVVEAARPDIVVISPSTSPSVVDDLIDTASIGFRVMDVADFHEHAFGLVPLHAVTPTWFMHLLHAYNKPYTRFAKRAFDVIVAVVGLLATCWLFPIVAFLVSRTPGPVFYRQTRLGEYGRLFTIYKFRSMRQDAEATGAVWAAERDPRITRVGAFLRKTRIDELPQLWNVLKGEMSIVGPRPERPEFLDELREAVPFWMRRHLVKPGCTGWAQITRGYTSDATGTSDKLARDLWYLRHRSVLLDLCICAKTFTTVFTGNGAR